MNLYVPSLNTSFEVRVSGPACACVSADGTKLEWKSSEFRGTHPNLGDLHISLLKSLGNSSVTSTGTITPLSPSALSSSDPDFFPAVNVNSFKFSYEIGGYRFFSKEPLIVSTVINSIPPIGSTYKLVEPVQLFMEGDPYETVAAVITDSNIEFFENPHPEGACLAKLSSFSVNTTQNSVFLELETLSTKKEAFFKWETLSEIDNTGFNLWCAQIENNKFTRITRLNGEVLILPKATSAYGATYQEEYTTQNSGLEDGLNYCVLEDVDSGGKCTIHCDYIDAIAVGDKTSLDNANLEVAKTLCEENVKKQFENFGNIGSCLRFGRVHKRSVMHHSSAF